MSDGAPTWTEYGDPDVTGYSGHAALRGVGPPRGTDLLADPTLNKDAAFTEAERDELGLRGLLPWRVVTIEEQVDIEMERIRRKADDLEKYIGLAALHDRNETLFYRVLLDHLDELAPIVYTPTVGQVCRLFGKVMRRQQGLWVTPDDVDRIPDLLRNTGRPNVRLIVATDNERILGLGDQGAGGMGIPIGKLALYTAGAGLHPTNTLAVSLDAGTDNEKLLADPHYLGYPKPRLRDGAYEAFIEAFVEAVLEVYPHAVLQWEDFKQHNAIRLLDRYRHRLASFNDDVQGTAAVVASGILTALRVTGQPLSAQRLVLIGAGASGIGIARLMEALLRDVGLSAREVRRAVVMVDSHGLLYEGRDHIADDKRPHALPHQEFEDYGFQPTELIDLSTVVHHVVPTVLVGASGIPGAITEAAVREMASQVATPMVLPLSNPTALAEATPSDVFAWSDGRALVATGSPFEPVKIDGRERVVGQANNVFIFPGIGLGTIVSCAHEVTDRMFQVAATTLASLVSPDRLASGAMYPGLSELRTVSRAIAIAVARTARDQGIGRMADDEQLEAAVDAAIWTPEYSQPSSSDLDER
jgi:malic enzyme